MSDVDLIVAKARLLACKMRVLVWCSMGPDGARPIELARMLELSPATICHHLKLLRAARLVEVTGSGKHRVYRWTSLRLGLVYQDGGASKQGQPEAGRCARLP